MRRPKRRTARKRRSVRAACRGKPLEAAGCSNGPTPDALGCSKTAVRPKRPSVRSDGLSERLRCLGMKIVLLGCEDCAARVCVEMLTAMCAVLGVRGAVNLGLQIGCHASVPRELAGGVLTLSGRRMLPRRGCLRRLPWVGECVSDSLLISSKHLGKNGLILSLVDRR